MSVVTPVRFLIYPGILLNSLYVFLDGQLYICLFSTRDKRFPFAMFGIFGDIILRSLFV